MHGRASFHGLASCYRRFVPGDSLRWQRVLFAHGPTRNSRASRHYGRLSSPPQSSRFETRVSPPDSLLKRLSWRFRGYSSSRILPKPFIRSPTSPANSPLHRPCNRYPPCLLKLLAVVHCLKVFRLSLLDRFFELRTDIASLQWFLGQWSSNHHQAVCSTLFWSFNLRLCISRVD